MATTYNSPKEMLGYIVVKFIERQLEVLQLMPYDRRAVFSYYYQIKGLDAQLMSFRDEMYLYSDTGEKINYLDAIPQIQEKIKNNWTNVHAKDYDDFLKAVYAWSELIASSYPKLGLVPETSGINRAYEQENVQEYNDQIPGDVNDGGSIETETESGAKQQNFEPETKPIVEAQRAIRQEQPIPPNISGNKPRTRFKF